jgi:fucose permease
MYVGLGGAVLQIRGALLPTFEDVFTVSESALGVITPVGTIGFVSLILLIGMSAGRVNIKQTLLVGLALTAVSLGAISVSPSFSLLLVFIALQSAGVGILRALDRTILSHLFQSNRGRIFSLQEMVWAVGGMLGPVLVTLVSGYSWRYVFPILAIGYAVLMIPLQRIELPQNAKNEKSLTASDARSLFSEPSIFIMSLALIAAGGIASVFFTWLPYYATTLFPRNISNLTLSLYLGAYIPGRLMFSYFIKKFQYSTLVIASGTLLVIALIWTLHFATGYAILAGIFVIGFIVSGLFPTLLTLGVESVPSLTGPINAIANLFAQIGFFVFPVVIGVLANVYSIQQAMYLQIVLAALLTLIIVVYRFGPFAQEFSDSGADKIA